MKKIITLLLVLATSTSSVFAQQPVEFKLSCSEPYAVYDFITKISDNYPDNELKSVFSNSKYNTEAFKKQIADFEQLPIDYTYAFTQYPSPLKTGLMSRDMLERNLAISQTIADFRNKSLGLIPNEYLSVFSETLENFLPIYRELVFEPNKTAFEVQKNNLQNYIKNNQFSDFFQTGLTFYNTNWDKSIPFELNLLPSLDKGNLGARAFINVAVCEAPLDLKDHVSFFSVAMHEIYHIVYDNQSLQMKENIQKWFNETKSPNSQYALLLMNEVLATALGNGYVIEQINKKADEGEWYANKYVSEMAKAIYPILKKYIEDKKPMDEAFVKAYVNTYDTQFPQWNNELSHLFAYRYIVADTPNDWTYFRRTFRKYSNNRMGAPVSATEVEKTMAMPITKVVVISQNHEQKLNLLKDYFDVLKNKKLNPKAEFIEIFNLPDNTKLFIINRHKSTVEDMMNKRFPNKLIK
jgi:hypothetical protein